MRPTRPMRASSTRISTIPRSDPAQLPWRRRALLALLGGLPLAGPPLVGLALAGVAKPATASSAAVEAFIAEVGDSVVDILRQETSADEKLAALKGLLDSHTNLDLVARLVLGRHWRAASAEERDEYMRLFRQLLMNTMAARLGDYGGETFEVAGSIELNERDSLVQTKVLRPNDAEPLNVDWRVRQSDGGLAIIDVVAEGVSLVVSQRNEVGSIVEREGMAGLIETMRERSGENETVL